MQPSAASAGTTADQDKPQGPLSPDVEHTTTGPGARPAPDPNTAARKSGALGAKGAMEHPNTQVTVLPDATREDQAERWGLTPDRLGDHLFTSDRRGHGPDDAVDVSGDSWDDHEDGERELEERGFLLDGGWTPITDAPGTERRGGGWKRSGGTSHRGVLHADEYVDTDALRVLVERELGFTYEQIRSVYKQGPKTAEKRELRARIDARLLALSCAGGQMLELARALGWTIKEGGREGGPSCDTMERALARARQEAHDG